MKLGDVCADCTYEDNVAAYGPDIATIANSLILKTKELQREWDLMTPVDVIVGSTDHFGQALTGGHAAMFIRVNLSRSNTDTNQQPLLVSLTSDSSKVMRNGEAMLKSVALQMPVTALNDVDVPLSISFSTDLSLIGGGKVISLTVPVALLKCDNDKGLIRSSDGKCLVEAKGDKQKLIAAIVFSAILCDGFGFVFYWSYKHSSRVLETLHKLVTGVGASIMRVAFELLDVISDVQALINLFLFDLNLSNLVFVRAVYVTLFAISLPASVAVMKATIDNVLFQWHRMHSRARAVVHHNQAMNTPVKPISGPQPPTKIHVPTKPLPPPLSDNFSVGSRISSAEDELIAAAVVPNGNDRRRSFSSTWNVAGTHEHLSRQAMILRRDLEYHRARSKYMQRVPVRMLTEDILLFVFNIYIYMVNESDPVFLQSRFRSSLDFSILMSAMHFGAQSQNIVTWLHANKVGELQRQWIQSKHFAAVKRPHQADAL